MCYPKPGPRCSNHALKALSRAMLNKRQNGGVDSYIQAQEAIDRAQADYDMTPAGMLELKRRCMGKNVSDEYVQRLALAKARRTEALASIGIHQDQGDIGEHTLGHNGIRPNPNIVNHDFLPADVEREGWGSRGLETEERSKVMKECHRASTMWVQKLEPEEIEAIAWITSNGSHVMNAHNSGRESEIWGNDIYSKRFISKAVKASNRAMDKAPLTQKPIIVYRGLNDGTPQEFIDSLQEGAEFKFPSHACSSIDPVTAKRFTDFSRPTIIEVKTRRIASTTSMSAWGTMEMETLIDARTKWRVVSVQEGVVYKRRNESHDNKKFRVIQIEPVGSEIHTD